MAIEDNTGMTNAGENNYSYINHRYQLKYLPSMEHQLCTRLSINVPDLLASDGIQ